MGRVTVAASLAAWKRDVERRILFFMEGQALNFYPVNKKGEYGAASMWIGSTFALHDGGKNKIRESASLYKGE